MSNSDLSLVNFLLWRAMLQKLYHQYFRDLDHPKPAHVTLLGPSNQDAIKVVLDRLLEKR